MRGRWVLAVSAGASLAFGGELEDARDDLATYEVAARRRGIEALVRLDSELAVDALVSGLRHGHKEKRKREAAYNKELGRILHEISKALEEGLEGSLDDLLAAHRRASELGRELKAATKMLEPNEVLLVEGAAALNRFESDEAWRRIERVARFEPTGPVRNACLRALIPRSSPEALPTLLELADDRDPRVRALAVRALGRHVAAPGVLEKLAECAGDKSWAVRRGAYASLAKGPADTVVPILVEARESEDGDQRRRIDRHLHALGHGPEPKPADPVAFGLPLSSTRVRFVIDMSKKMDDRIVDVRIQLTRALEALPDTAVFEIVCIAPEPERFAKKPKRASASNVRRALAWFRKLPVAGPSNDWALLAEAMTDYGDRYAGKRVFRALADTIYLVCWELDRDATIPALEKLALWNLPVDATLNVVAYGKELPRAELEEAVEKTGGRLIVPD